MWLTCDNDEANVHQVRVPLLSLKVGIGKNYHANDGLNIVGDARAGDNQPPNNAQQSDNEGQKVAILRIRHDVGKMILSFSGG